MALECVCALALISYSVHQKKRSKGPRKPEYTGPPPPPNRFGIKPGYRWDGVGECICIQFCKVRSLLDVCSQIVAMASRRNISRSKMNDDVAELRVTSGVWTICDCLGSPLLLFLLTLPALHAMTLLFQATAGWKSCTAGRVVRSSLSSLFQGRCPTIIRKSVKVAVSARGAVSVTTCCQSVGYAQPPAISSSYTNIKGYADCDLPGLLIIPAGYTL